MTERPTAALVTEPEAEQEKKTWFDLSLFQVLGGALAAMTAAALGSRISVGGTVMGAAVASVIAAVAGAIYTSSLRRTSQTVRGMLGRRSGSGSTAAPASDSDPSPASTLTAWAIRRRTLLVSSVVGAVAIFAVAAGALTIYEMVSGRALSGGSGTTVSQVRQADRENRPTDEPASVSSESPDAESTAESSSTPEAESSATPEPSSEPTATSEPSDTSEAEPQVTPQSEPSSSAEPPSSAPSQPVQTPR
jgi:hypothetical protein